MVCQHSKLYNSWLNKVNWPFSSPVCLSALEARPPPLWLVEGSGRQTGGCNSALLQVCPGESCGVGVHQSWKGGSPDCFLCSHLLHLRSFHGICNLQRMSESMVSLYITVNEFGKVCRFNVNFECQRTNGISPSLTGEKMSRLLRPTLLNFSMLCCPSLENISKLIAMVHTNNSHKCGLNHVHQYIWDVQWTVNFIECL